MNKDLFSIPPYSLTKKSKQANLLNELKSLCFYHNKKCLEYSRILKALNCSLESCSKIENLPFLPTDLFKKLKLMSIHEQDIFKHLKSSGTSGEVSNIFLDKENAHAQQKALTLILKEFLGDKRLPMLIIDSKSTLTNRNEYAARGAAILGFSLYAKKIVYALNDNLELDINTINEFLTNYGHQKFFIFGFTSIIYSALCKCNNKFNLSNGILIHGGGWKKLSDLNIDNNTFKNILLKKHKLNNVHNYYGMVEQTGSIYFECEHGYMHTTNFSDIIIRDHLTFMVKNEGSGLIQTISLLPTSYPGHNLITADIGIICGEDDCKCNKKGKYFKVLGRAQKTPVRGCSDAY